MRACAPRSSTRAKASASMGGLRYMSIRIDLTTVTQPALVAVKRAAAFLAMGFRAVNLPPPTELNVDQHSMVTFFSSPLSSQLADDVVIQFRIWLIGAALRELDAGYSLYLDGVFQAATMIKERVASDNIMRRKATKTFIADTNVANKLSTLRKSFGLRVNSQSHIERVSMARNVLQHAAGIVRERECVHHGNFELTWLGFDTRMVGKSTGAVENIINDVLREPFMSQDPEGCWIEIVFVDRKRIFAKGDIVDLTPHNLHEICNMYQMQAIDIHNNLAEYATEQGVHFIGEAQNQITMRVEYLPNDEMRRIRAAEQQPDA